MTEAPSCARKHPKPIVFARRRRKCFDLKHPKTVFLARRRRKNSGSKKFEISFRVKRSKMKVFSPKARNFLSVLPYILFFIMVFSYKLIYTWLGIYIVFVFGGKFFVWLGIYSAIYGSAPLYWECMNHVRAVVVP